MRPIQHLAVATACVLTCLAAGAAPSFAAAGEPRPEAGAPAAGTARPEAAAGPRLAAAAGPGGASVAGRASALPAGGSDDADAILRSARSGRWERLAADYAARIESDPANAAAWTACAELAASRGPADDADSASVAHAERMEQALQALVEEGSRPPCPELLP